MTFYDLTFPVSPEPLGAETGHGVHAVVQEDAHLGLVVPPGQGSLVQAGPVGLVSGPGARHLSFDLRSRSPRDQRHQKRPSGDCHFLN